MNVTLDTVDRILDFFEGYLGQGYTIDLVILIVIHDIFWLLLTAGIMTYFYLRYRKRD